MVIYHVHACFIENRRLQYFDKLPVWFNGTRYALREEKINIAVTAAPATKAMLSGRNASGDTILINFRTEWLLKANISFLHSDWLF